MAGPPIPACAPHAAVLPEPVRGARARDPGVGQGAGGDACHRRGRQRPVRSVQGQERLPVCRPGRAPVAQVLGQRLPDVGWQGHLIEAVSLPRALSTPERQSMSSSSSEATSRARSASRSINATIGSFLTPSGPPDRTAANKSPPWPGLSLLGGAVPRGKGADRSCQRRRGQPLLPHEAEQDVQGIGPHLRRARAQPAALCAACTQRGPPAGSIGVRRDERPHLEQVARHRRRSQAPLVGQISSEPRQQHLPGIPPARRRSRLHDPEPVQGEPSADRSVRSDRSYDLLPTGGDVLTGHLFTQLYAASMVFTPITGLGTPLAALTGGNV